MLIVDTRGAAEASLPTFCTLRRGYSPCPSGTLFCSCRDLDGVAQEIVMLVSSLVNAALNCAASSNPDSIKASCTESCNAFFLFSPSCSYVLGFVTTLVSLWTCAKSLGESCLECAALVYGDKEIICGGGRLSVFRYWGRSWSSMRWRLNATYTSGIGCPLFSQHTLGPVNCKM
jgi:hypothetical protein